MRLVHGKSEKRISRSYQNILFPVNLIRDRAVTGTGREAGVPQNLAVRRVKGDKVVSVTGKQQPSRR